MPTPDAPLAQAHVDQAIDWLVQLRFGQPTAQTEQRFRNWLERDPHHALAWQRVEAMSDEFAGLPRDLSRRTLDGSQRRRISRRDSLKLLGLLTAAGSLGWFNRDPLGLPSLLADQRTTTGERRSFSTAEGSQIQLNTDSAIDLRFGSSLRLLSLVRGEVAIDSGSDPRPLQVQTRNGHVQTSSARLLLRERADGTLLAVREGEVAMFAGPRHTPLQIARAGETWLFDSSGRLQKPLTHSDPWGWSEGVLSVQQMPLGEFLAELSRYRPGLLRCADEVAELRVSGTYQLADTDQILALIAQALPVRVDYRTRYWVSVSAV